MIDIDQALCALVACDGSDLHLKVGSIPLARVDGELGPLSNDSTWPVLEAADTEEALREALENLSYRERRVLELRYGLGGEHPRTLDEVGRTFNVTRERIRQIENQSLKKLQSLAEAQKLRALAESQKLRDVA